MCIRMAMAAQTDNYDSCVESSTQKNLRNSLYGKVAPDKAHALSRVSRTPFGQHPCRGQTSRGEPNSHLRSGLRYTDMGASMVAN